jgi:hypothetical protein
MKSTHQQCHVCDAPISGEAYHAIVRGKIYRFCCAAHRSDFRSALAELMRVDNGQP